jgi:hypothetical protein
MADTQLERIMKNLKCSKAEAEAILAEDKRIDRGERTDFDLDPEAEKRAKRYGQDDPNATELRLVSYEGKKNNGREILQAFDVMADVFSRATSNPGMIDHWHELTGDILENM